MDQLQLPGGVDELEEWLANSGGRTGRVIGARRARWEDWSIVHALATGPYAPFQCGLGHLSRVGDGQFELRPAPGAPAEGTLFAAMIFFEAAHQADDVVDALFDITETALRWHAATGRRRWLAVDLVVDEADLDADEVRAALEVDPRLPEFAWFDFCAALLAPAAPVLLDKGVLRPATPWH